MSTSSKPNETKPVSSLSGIVLHGYLRKECKEYKSISVDTLHLLSMFFCGNQLICSFHRDFMPDISMLSQYFSQFGTIMNKIEYEYSSKKVPLTTIEFANLLSINKVFDKGNIHQLQGNGKKFNIRIYSSIYDYNYMVHKRTHDTNYISIMRTKAKERKRRIKVNSNGNKQDKPTVNTQKQKENLQLKLNQSIYRGICISFDPAKGFGFITMNDGNSDIFVHYSDIISNGFKTLQLGEPVEFTMVIKNGKRKAIGVKRHGQF
eukprot:26607_1